MRSARSAANGRRKPTDLPPLVAEVENHVSLAGPVLHLMHQRERPWHQRLRDAARQRLQRLRQGQGRGLALGLVLGAAALAAVLVLPVEHRVGGPGPRAGRTAAHRRGPAGRLPQGRARAPPVTACRKTSCCWNWADQELLLQQRKWASDLAQQENAYASALARADRAAMVIALARADEARAQLALIDNELARTRVTAPFASVIVEGDLSQSLGAPVERGRQLMVLAPLDRYRVIVQVDERDIARVQPGQQGQLSLSALPWDSLPVRVQRITALAQAADGRNVFRGGDRRHRRRPARAPWPAGRGQAVGRPCAAGLGAVPWRGRLAAPECVELAPMRKTPTRGAAEPPPAAGEGFPVQPALAPRGRPAPATAQPCGVPAADRAR